MVPQRITKYLKLPELQNCTAANKKSLKLPEPQNGTAANNKIS